MSAKIGSNDGLKERFATNGHNCRQTSHLDPKVSLKRLTIDEINHFTNQSINSSDFAIDGQQREPIEKCIESLESKGFMRYLGLISPKDLKTKPLIGLKQSFPVRRIDTIGVPIVDNETNQVIGNSVVIQRLEESQMKAKPKRVDKRVVKRRRKSCSRLLPKKIVKQKTLKTNDWIKSMQKIESNKKHRLLQYISRLPFTSRLAHFLSTTFGFKRLSDSSVESLADKHIDVNTYSQNTDLLKPNNRYINVFNKWLPKNIRSKAQDMELSEALSRQDFHYDFTRRQNREKSLRLKTHLNWRSRLETMHCKPTTLCLTPLSDQSLRELMYCGQQMVDQSDKPAVSPMSPSESATKESEIDFDLNDYLNESIDKICDQLGEDMMTGGGDTVVLKTMKVVLEKDLNIDLMAITIAAKQSSL